MKYAEYYELHTNRVHREPRVVIMPNLSLLATPQTLTLTTEPNTNPNKDNIWSRQLALW